MRQKERDPTQSYDRSPNTNRKFTKPKYQHKNRIHKTKVSTQKHHNKLSITQRLHDNNQN